MPSWKTHEIIGDLVLGYHNSEIDKIVDFTFGHDSSRYDAEKLIEAIDRILSNYGEIGLKYFILHHYLDRLVDILVSEISFAYESYILSQEKIDKLCTEIAENSLNRLFCDPKNILSLFVYDLETLKRVLSFIYHGKSRRRQRKHFEELLDEAYVKLQRYEKFEFVRSIVLEVLRGIKNSFNKILFLVLTDESFGNPRTIHRIAWSTGMKLISRSYRLSKYSHEPSNNLMEDLPKFISVLIDHFKLRLQDLE